MKRLILAATVLVTSTVAFAGPLKPQSIPANATWFLHIDAQAINSSTFGKCILAGMQKAGAKEFQEIHTKLGIDPHKDIYSITAFGIGESPANGLSLHVEGRNIEVAARADSVDNVIVIAELKADAAKTLIERLSAIEGAYKQLSLGDYKVHAMIEPADDDDEDGEGEIKLLVYVKPSDDAKRKTLVVSDKKQLLLAAIKTLTGKAPNLTSNENSTLSYKHSDGSLLVMSASDIHELTGGNGGGISKILKVSEAFNFEISEVDEMVNFNVSVTTDSATIAKNLMDMAQGALAFARLSMQDEIEDENLAVLLSLAESLNFSADGNQLSVSFEHSAKALCELVEAKISEASHDDDDDDDDDEDDDDDDDDEEDDD